MLFACAVVPVAEARPIVARECAPLGWQYECVPCLDVTDGGYIDLCGHQQRQHIQTHQNPAERVRQTDSRGSG